MESNNSNENVEYIPVYGDTEATTAKGKGGIYQYEPQNPDQLGQLVRNVCAKSKIANSNMQEIIELGFSFGKKVLDIFLSARVNPILDPFVTELCGITQEMLREKPTFKDGFQNVCDQLSDVGVDVNNPKYLAVFCGDWDFKFPLTAHFLNDDIKPPVFFERVCNIKVIFNEAIKSGEFPEIEEKHTTYVEKNTRVGGKKRTTMVSMLHALDLELDGDHHRAHDDAANIAKIGDWLLDNGQSFRPTYEIDLTKYH